MSRFLLDTGAAQDFLNGRRGVRARAEAKRHQGQHCMRPYAEGVSQLSPGSRVCERTLG